MGLISMVQEARKKQQLANTAIAREARAQEKIQRAENRVQLEKNKMALRIAKTERQLRELDARVALEKAKTEVNKAKAAQTRASEEKWLARQRRIAVIGAPIGSAVIATSKGMGKVAKLLWDEPKSKRKVRRKRR